MKNENIITETTLTATIPEGMTGQFTIHKTNHKPSFNMVGSGLGSIDKGTYSMNFTKYLLSLSKPAGFLFDLIMDGRLPYVNPTTGLDHPYKLHNTSALNTSNLSSSEKNYITKGYKELLHKNMVVRQARNRYIINPRLLISGDEWQIEDKLYLELRQKLNIKEETNGE